MNTLEQCQRAAADRSQLTQSLAAADVVPLMASLVHLTGDETWLDKTAPYIKGGWSFLVTIPEAMAAAIRSELQEVILDIAAGVRTPHRPSEALLIRIMNTAVGQEVPPEYRPILSEEAQFDGVDPRRVEWRDAETPSRSKEYHVLIIGAGLSGIAMAIRLAEAGIPYTIIEKNSEVGGTWFENIYPGIAVDTPNHFYSYSFAPNPNWSRYFATGGEIQKYILECVERFGIRDRIRFGEEVVAADYNEPAARWNIVTKAKDGSSTTLSANAVVSAVGALNRPSIPKIPGLDTFDGPVFHTARWREDVSLEGKRVALIGTGASGIQVAPKIAPTVAKLSIFQRSPHWIIKHPLYFSELGPDVHWAMSNIPGYMKWFRFMLFWAASDGFHATLKIDPDWTKPELSLNPANHKMREDLIAYYESKIGHRPDLMKKVIPCYPPFGKRMLRDTNWFEMLERSNVDLVTDDIDHVEPGAIVMKDGSRHDVDVIILATGFEAAKMIAPLQVIGRDGATLRDLWGEDDPRAYLGITVPKFPNFFMIYGPNTNLAHGGSAIFHSECQVRYIMQALREMLERGAAWMECRESPFNDYNAKVDDKLRTMVWAHPGVTNWYKNKKGRVIMNSPWRLAEYRDLTATIDPEDFAFETPSKP
ncbi:flavin-containing monooxygenase [Variovorax ginsengisoli]|uniref:NAD(P)/FAD-dependent oxidoreductase n=1 Tax=Variovorax ginsengisoli TaxID=363844 RepID=A0ABT8SA07_9BURK|nr:NAD(P)/FAD-dependent oxidoreductase [Variovorax ginsengisoli]MDN8616435.1 NAD(P)/FAD-dependent oxidoreductase [Variovorax ginsengisoli]MDO1535605.1 NAD(P)/FAD-dependent oxidoreductase [Variovorax ginsengisoli]